MDFGTNRKLVYDLLLVISTNFPPILHRFQVMADYTVSQKTSPTFIAITRENIDGFL